MSTAGANHPEARVEAVRELPAAPALWLMHAAFVLTGMGTLLLGPILPLLAAQWHLSDAHAGTLATAQFCGSFVGGFTTYHRLRACFAQGMWAAAVGFCLFALAPGLPLACAGLVLGGFGVGRVITANNILAGRRYPEERGSMLARLNLSWSFGALLSPLVAAWLTPHFTLRTLLLGFAALFVACGLRLAYESRGEQPEEKTDLDQESSGAPFALSVFLYFMALLCLYGGMETCFSVWLTTFAQRFGRASAVLSDYTLVLLLTGLTAGRAIASRLLERVKERRMASLSLAISALLAAALAFSRRTTSIAVLAVLLGVALAPIFPAIFANFLSFGPPARKAGIVLAVSGLGAAFLPWLMGVVSTRTGSLGVALAIPAATAIVMLLLTLAPMRRPA